MMLSVAPFPSKLSSVRIRISLSLLLTVLLLPVTSRAQVSYSGTPASVNFGSQAIGTPSAAKTLSFSISAGTTVGSIGVLTQGAANLDFTNAAGSTCTATTYSSATSCTVDVTFTPKAAGLRMGAVVFFTEVNHTGTVLASVPVYGVGNGPQIGYDLGIQTIYASGGGDFPGNGEHGPTSGSLSGLVGPLGMAADAVGNLFIADSYNNRVAEVPAGGDSIVTAANVNNPFDVAVDGAGDLFVTVGAGVLEIPVGGGATVTIAPTVNGLGLSGAWGVAVDGGGDLFIADSGNNRVVEVPAGGAAVAIDPTANGEALNSPAGVALDGRGNLLIADTGNNRVVKVPVGGGTATSIGPTLDGVVLSSPTDLAVDGAGDLFVLDTSYSRAVEAPAAGSTAIILGSIGGGLNYGGGVAVDANGNLFFSFYYYFGVSYPTQYLINYSEVLQLQSSQPPAFNFPTVTNLGTTDTTDGVMTVPIQNVGNETLLFSAIGYPADFSEPSGGTSACTGSTSLNPGHGCEVSIEFAPLNGGLLLENLTLTDNALNGTDAEQSLGLEGIGLDLADVTHFSVTAPASVVAGTPFSITVTGLNSSNQTVTGFNGTVTFTSSDPGFVNPGPLTLSSGVGQATVTLGLAGTQTITTADATNPFLTGSASLSVAPAPLGLAIYTGSAANQNFGSLPVGSTSAARTLNISVLPSATVGSIGVVTTGIANLDFNVAPGGSCTAGEFSSVTTCTVDVTFTPMGVGPRMGAVDFFSGPNQSGTVVGSVLVYGVGTGPQITYAPLGNETIYATGGGDNWGYQPLYGLVSPMGMTEDAAGDLLIANYSAAFGVGAGVSEVPAGGGALMGVNGGVYGTDVAVDGAGDFFVATGGSVEKVPAVGGLDSAIDPTVNGLGLSDVMGVAVDGTGDLFIADTGNNRVVEVPAGGGAATAIDPTVNGISLAVPLAVVVDGAGDLFIADSGNNRVVEVPAGGGAATAVVPTASGEILGVYSLAVDAAGDLFFLDANGNVDELPTVGGAVIVIPPVSSLALPLPDDYYSVQGMALGATGDVFISLFYWQYDGYPPGMGTGDNYSDVVKVQRSEPLAMVFNTIGETQTMQVQNSGNTALTLTSVSYPADFSEASGDANACTGSTSLSPGQACDLPIQFTPQNSGTLNESVVLTDNALNVAGAQQSISVSGVSQVSAATLISPTQGSKFAGSGITFTWSAGIGATSYNFWLGSSGAGSNNVYNGASTAATFATVANVPVNGETIYARLQTNFNGASTYVDYTFMAAGPQALLTSPAPGSVLPGSSATFSWTMGVGVTEYWLDIGTTGAGSTNVYNKLATTTSASVTTLPIFGQTVYVRLLSKINGRWLYYDYIYTAAGTSAPAVMQTPAPGSTLAGSSATFTWTAGVGVTEYWLYMGTTGAGSTDVYNSSVFTTFGNVTTLPVFGQTVYVRLLSKINGSWLYNDYTYTAAGRSAPAVMQNPAPGNTLSGSSVTFNWSAGIGVTEYWLYVGTTGVGSTNVYDKLATSTSASVTGMPTNGTTVYVRLLSKINGAWQYNDYTYQAQ